MLIDSLQKLLSAFPGGPEPSEPAADAGAEGHSPQEAADQEARASLAEGAELCMAKQFEDALRHFQSAQVKYVKLRDRRSSALCQKIIGLVSSAIREPEIVRRTYKQAIGQLKRAGLREEEGIVLLLIGRFELTEYERLFHGRQFKEAKSAQQTALTHFGSARRMFDEMRLADLEVDALLLLAQTEASRNDRVAAERFLDEIRRLASLLKRPDLETRIATEFQ